jgi:hypothetical protein
LTPVAGTAMSWLTTYSEPASRFGTSPEVEVWNRYSVPAAFSFRISLRAVSESMNLLRSLR